MNRKLILGIILGLTIFILGIVLIITHKTKYNKLVLNENQWNQILQNKKSSTSIKIERLEFNDYHLMIDEENATIYYSVVEGSNRYNPFVRYTLNDKKLKIAFSSSLDDSVREDSESIKVMIYNNQSYRIYSFVVTSYPILSITYHGDEISTGKINIELEIFDNHVDSPRRFLKSDGKLRVIEDNQEYSFSLVKESLGNNKRDNYISIFGMEKRDEYIVKKVSSTEKNDRYVRLFMNGKYKGIYSFGPKEEKGNDNYGRNRENNK